ncbi:uncharacterized protein LOC135201081 [Macrobrachium nipponense]|uniref:uncharacterized protein LOC135201081 n=1 Tax=Macrobrachium nipponense TaxID=159736 RepID=UPI0030C8CC09
MWSLWIWAAAVAMVAMNPCAHAKGYRAECETLPSTVHVSKEEYDEAGRLLRTCEEDLAVNKCEGACLSKVQPSVNTPVGVPQGLSLLQGDAPEVPRSHPDPLLRRRREPSDGGEGAALSQAERTGRLPMRQMWRLHSIVALSPQPPSTHLFESRNITTPTHHLLESRDIIPQAFRILHSIVTLLDTHLFE